MDSDEGSPRRRRSSAAASALRRRSSQVNGGGGRSPPSRKASGTSASDWRSYGDHSSGSGGGGDLGMQKFEVDPDVPLEQMAVIGSVAADSGGDSESGGDSRSKAVIIGKSIDCTNICIISF